MILNGLEYFRVHSRTDQTDKLAAYVSELVRWNARMNLTGLTDAPSIIRELLGDAFYLANHMKRFRKVIDLGSGGGVLAIPLRILVEGPVILSLDKSMKKIQFQKHVRRTLLLHDFEPIHGRIEEIEPLGADCVIAKALGSFGVILGYARRHLDEGGEAFFVKGAEEVPPDTPGFAVGKTSSYSLPGTSRKYRLLTFKKIL